MRRLALVLTALAAAVALYGLGLLLWIALHRDGYPYDLEWMEGSMLCHALRLLHGQGIYGPPAVDFIPHLYTPLYPAVVAALGALTGDVTYLGGRLVSLGSFLGALAIGGWLCARGLPAERRGALVLALCALGLPVLGFDLVCGWYDLCRSDSLQVLLTVAGLAVAWRWRDSHRAMLGAALLLCLGFFAKQTAAPLIVLGGLAVLAARPRQGLTLALAGAAILGAGVYLLDRTSSGWFWIYIFRLHQQHPFDWRRAFGTTPLVLGRALGVGLLLVPWALWRHRCGTGAGGLRYLAWLGLAGALTACIGAGTQWSHVNAYIPGLFFPALAVGAAAGRLGSGPRWQQAAVAGLLLASLLPQLYRPGAHLPAPGSVAAGDAVIARLRQAPGEVLIPFHPFYAHLAGKRTYLHRMGVWDVRGTAAGPVRGLAQALRERRFSRIIFDQKVEWTWGDWPDVLSYYRIVERFVGPRTVEGADTLPALMLEPIARSGAERRPSIAPAGTIDRELQ